MTFSVFQKQEGAALVEAIFVLPLFFFLVGGIIEFNYLHRTRATLNMATFDAVREGAVSNVDKGSMKSSLSASMMATFTGGSTDAAGIAQALATSTLFEATLSGIANTQGLDTINILSPNRDVFNAFRSDVLILDGQTPRYIEAIPNDNLMYRSPAVQNVTVNGESVVMNVQDANLVKIKTLWCHRLIIPGLRDIAERLILDPGFAATITPEQRVCNILGDLPGPLNGTYVAVTSQSIARAQSYIPIDDLE